MALTVFCLAIRVSAAPTVPYSAAQDFPQVVPYELGSSEFAAGDSITILEFRGDAQDIAPGGTYCIVGTYTLSSQAEADLSFFATTTNSAPTPIDPRQTVRVKKGIGSFRLIKKVTEDGYLHLTFYSRASGQGIGGVYFGQGQWVLRDKHFSYLTPATRREKSSGQEPVSATGPNEVLLNYLGNPVPSPANLDAAYTKDGLAGAMQTAAQNAGISLAKLEIDDSEFPFLIGVIFADKSDKAKFLDQVRKVAAYTTSGGVGGDTSYAMNIVPHPVFPPEASQRIYHRLMLREAVLHDKITGVQ